MLRFQSCVKYPSFILHSREILMLLSIHDLKIYGYFEKVVGKVHATIPKGIVGGFEVTVLQISLKE